jgi:tripartite-type tricarboxylate transporter receptor subunit TctC
LTFLARERVGALTFASSAIGGSPHLAAALYQKMTGVSMKHVCYERTQQLYADLVDGRISLSFNNIMSMLPLLSAGKLRGIAVTGATRSSVVPHLPTIAESGLTGYEVTNWLGIVAPAGMEPKAITTLNDAIVGTLQSNDVKPILAAHGMEVAASSASEFASHIRSELAKWAPLVRERIAGNT